MNTTPKPSATKKSKGELVGPPPPELADDVAAGGIVVVLEGKVVGAAEEAIFALVQTVFWLGYVRSDLVGPGIHTNLKDG